METITQRGRVTVDWFQCVAPHDGDGRPASGAAPEGVQTRLGHSQISTTRDIYSDALSELDAMAADLLDAEPIEEI